MLIPIQMKLQIALCYSYIYGIILNIHFKYKNKTYIATRVAPPTYILDWPVPTATLSQRFGRNCQYRGQVSKTFPQEYKRVLLTRQRPFLLVCGLSACFLVIVLVSTYGYTFVTLKNCLLCLEA
jgi:hypothetical protein